MKNMGLMQLILVNPLRFPHSEAVARASGAEDVLASAKVVKTLEEAIGDCEWIFGTSARDRILSWPQLTPAECAQKVIEYSHQQQKTAIVFGAEQSGLTNAQLQACDYHVTIPTHPGYASLNLAAAVQILAYEIYVHSRPFSKEDEKEAEKATRKEVNALMVHFEEVACQLQFLDPRYPRKLLPRVKRLFTKAQLEKEEVGILRGFLNAIQQRLNQVQS